MKGKMWAAFFAAACLFWSGGGEARHLAETRAAEARTAKAAEEEEARQRAWELAQEAAAEKATGEASSSAKASGDDAAPGNEDVPAAPAGRENAPVTAATAAEEAAPAEKKAEARPAAEAAPLAAKTLEPAAAAQAETPPTEKEPAVHTKKGTADQTAESKTKGTIATDKAGSSLRHYLDRLREKADEIIYPADPNLKVRDTRPMKVWASDITDSGGTLIFSDSPEYVDRPGILYTDELDGAARVLFYHLNQTKKPAKVLLLMENTSARAATVEITRRGVSQPGEDYLAVGKATQAAYFSDAQKRDQFTIKQGERHLLMSELEKIVLAPESLIYGVVDFSASAPVRLWVLLSPAELDPFAYLKIAPLLPKDEQRLRGTFQGMNRTIRAREGYDPGKDGTVYFPIGDNKTDRFLTGIDATDGSLVTNVGNYGVLYRVEVPIEGRRPLRAMLNPIGGVYAGVMRIQTAEHDTARVVPTPLRGIFFGDGVKNPVPMRGDTPLLDPAAAVADLGFYRRTSGLSFEFSPPGASNLPARLILTPEDEK